MAYQENKPLPTDRLKDSQADLQGNFQSNKAAFDQNHTTFDDADAGKHKFMQMPEQGAAPTTAANEMGLYTKEDGGVAQMFIRRESDGTEINLTNNATQATAGTMTLPSGLIMKWGETTAGGLLANDWTQITYPVAFPNTCFNIQVTSKAVTVQPSTAQTTASVILDVNYASNLASFYVFNRRTDAGTGYVADCTWFAIGN